MSRPSARDVFSTRSGRYVSSATHADPNVLGRVAGLAAVGAGSIALDVGTGTGHTAFALAQASASVVGCDITPQMLQQARSHAPDDAALSFVQGDAHHLPFPNDRFDAVTCRRTAHHFEAVEDALAEMVRVLRPGGRLVIDDRSIPEDDAVDAFINDLDRVHDPSHIREYRASEWRRILESQGLRVLEESPYTQHRKIDDYVKGIDTETGRRIREVIASTSDDMRARIDFREDAYTHWFLTIAAEKPA